LSPEAAVGGPIALVEQGDAIIIDAVKKTIDVRLTADELERRRRAWRPRSGQELRGLLAKYARLVSSASQGAITDS
jgi:dihydroxy-acid dehydratase